MLRFLTVPFLLSLTLAACRASSTADEDGASVCVGKAPPPGATAMKLKLSLVDFGEADPDVKPSSAAWRTVGFNLDGLCSSATRALSCKPRHELGQARDGDLGIDNAFGGLIAFPLGGYFYDGRPSPAWSGGSYLELDPGGSGVLLLIGSKGTFRVPLVRARVESADGQRGTLGAIVPREAFIKTLREDLAATTSRPCDLSTVAGVVDSMTDVADIPTLGTPGWREIPTPTEACDGISIGLTFEGTPVADVPTPQPAACEQTDGGAPDAPDGG